MKLDLKEWIAKSSEFTTDNTQVKVLVLYVGGVVRKLLKALKPLTLGRGWAV